ncbi:MAG: ABC transporter permease [Pseudomonadota bacterium]
MRTLIKPRNSFAWVDWKLIYQYRDLLGLWVKRDIASKYRQTLLGPLWFVFQPLVTALIFVVIFSKGLKISTDGVPAPLFYLTGLIIWNYVSQCLNSTSMTLVAHSGLFKKVFFPRLILPFSYCVSSLVSMGIQSGVLAFFYLYFLLNGSSTRPDSFIFFLPLLLIQLLLLSFGLGLWISSLTVRYRDFHHIWSLISPLWLYATPVSYPLSAIPLKWQWVIKLNPLTTIIEGFRAGILGVGTFTASDWIPSVIFSFAIAFSGMIMFQTIERNCVDSL